MYKPNRSNRFLAPHNNETSFYNNLQRHSLPVVSTAEAHFEEGARWTAFEAMQGRRNFPLRALILIICHCQHSCRLP